MKKLLAALLALIICALASALAENVRSEYRQEQYTYTVLADGTAEIIRWEGFETDLVILQELGGVPVSSIGNGAFRDRSSLISVTVPEGVTRIGDMAFAGCSISYITLPDSVTEIGDSAFLMCTDLMEMTLPENLERIGNEAFSRCIGLQGIIIPDSVTEIGDHAFSGCECLKSVTLPENLRVFGNNPFRGCTALEADRISADSGNFRVTGGALFDRTGEILVWFPCGSSGTEYAVPEGTRAIGDCAFEGCCGLVSVILPASMEKIGDHAFYGCESLTEMEIPGSKSLCELRFSEGSFRFSG